MTYFETPADAAAYYAGLTVSDMLAKIDAREADLDALDAMGQPHLDPEARTLISEDDIETVTEQDRADLDLILAWEQFEGFGR